MKTWLTLMLLGAALVCRAGTVTFGWDASPGANGYVFYGHTNATLTTNLTAAVVKIDTGTNRVASIQYPAAGTWYFVATAYSMSGSNKLESGPSNMLVLTFVPPPANFVYMIPQWTAELGSTNWTDLGYFRLKIGQ